MRLAVVFQMLFPGAPCVFYGVEAGLTGVTEPEYRRPMDWENAEGSWFDFYRQVAGLRAKYLNGTERFTVSRGGASKLPVRLCAGAGRGFASPSG